MLLLLAVALPVALLLLLLGLMMMVYYLWRRKKRRLYQELVSTVPTVPECTAPIILVSQGPWARNREIPFALPPRLTPPSHRDPNERDEAENVRTKVEVQRGPDATAHRGSLSVQSWYPVGTLRPGLYSVPALGEVAAPPPSGTASRLCFAVEYRHGAEQLAVSLLRLGNLPPRFQGNVTLVELRLLPEDRRPRQAKARGTGPDPEFGDCLVFQVSGTGVFHSTLSMCVLSVGQDGKRQSVGKVLFPLEGELGQAGRMLWKDLETEEDAETGSALGEVEVSLSYSPSLQRLYVVVLSARGLELLTKAGVCVQVTLQMHARVVKSKQSRVVPGESDPYFDHRMTFKLKSQHLDEACLRLELLQPKPARSEPPDQLGVLVLGPFMYTRGLQLQHWMDVVSAPQKVVKRWHRLSRAA